MTKEELSECHARALAAAGRLRLPLRAKVWKGQAGSFLGAGSGSSLDFQDHRSYIPGDDPRHINWNAYARTGTYTMKLYREEVRPVVDVVLDVSDSMFFVPEKAHRVAELFSLIVESAKHAGASTLAHLVKGPASRPMPTERVSTSAWYEDAMDFDSPDASAPPNLSAVPFRHNAIRVFISDLLFPGDPEPCLQHLASRQGSPILLAPYTASEADPEWQGQYDFIDAEKKSRHPHKIEPSVLRRYKEAYGKHFSQWKTSVARHNAAFARVASEPDLQSALLSEAVPSGTLEIAT